MTCIKQILMCSYVNDVGYYVTCPFEGDPKTCVALWPFMQMTQFKAFFLQLHV